MTTQFDEWLLALRRARQGPVSINIDRSLPFLWRFALSGDWTGATIKASLRAAPDIDDPYLADFAVSAPELVDDLTVFALTLTAPQTASLPTAQGNEGAVVVVFDTLVTPQGGVQQRLFGGAATISGKVTNAG
ncbi:hypothetical protein [Novosphingobium sp. HII-3]|uniref:hypothetical protein n=1 Tax=Novosphingobium sp. HII-3 TaxID=2075565 RepID=UPI000CDB88BD|nr:hypothetical protein [Novosphingobium sp. HII-3]